MDKKRVAHFGLLWGGYINTLGKGNMGNFRIIPGSHHSIASIFRTKGTNYFFEYLEGKKQD